MEEYRKILAEYIKFKSISTDKEFLPEIYSCVKFLKELFEKNGLETKIIEGYDNPLVYGEYDANKKETVLIYGHYDVQPAKKEDGWKEDPFVLYEDEKKFYGRGTADNKGQTLIHLYTIFKLLKENNLGYNIKIILEGNEETGSNKLEKFLRDYKGLLKSDFVLISDGEIVGSIPILDSGFRGVINLELEVKTANRDFHSGLYGGVLPNALHEIIKILNTFFDKEDRVLIKGFYEKIEKIDKEIIRLNKKLPFNEKKFKKETGVKKLFTKDLDFYTKTGLWATIQLTGLSGGYFGEGFRNAVPHSALAKINIRFVEKQEAKEIVKKIKSHLKKVAPSYVNYKLRVKEIAPAVKLDLNNPYTKKAKEVLKKVFKKEPVFKFSGGGLPIVFYFKNILKVPQVLVPLANEDCNMHSINENFDKKLIQKGLEFSYFFLKNE
jgi:acetylornithine deacetylase/succinyl-diaminopimelate desuccinylase-like protein